ncbi:MAG: hypothetical protein RLO51_28960 [Thalassobaculum sp.]|uniref:hypothetical protein n=1 Tax=Thalassobaculum sp. TaxID=2022740 RepID=UPI0032EBF752
MTSTLAVHGGLSELSEIPEEERDGLLFTDSDARNLPNIGYEKIFLQDGYRPGSAWHISDVEYISDLTVRARLQQEIYWSRLSHLHRDTDIVLENRPPRYQLVLFIARVAVSIIHGLSYVGTVWGGFWLYGALESRQIEFYMPALLLIVFSIVLNLTSAKILHSPGLGKLKRFSVSKGGHFAAINR